MGCDGGGHELGGAHDPPTRSAGRYGVSGVGQCPRPVGRGRNCPDGSSRRKWVTP